MDACEIIDLQTSRANWRFLSIALLSIIAVILIFSTAYMLGKVSVEEEVRYSGYKMIEMHTATNSYYKIEKVER